MNADLTNLTRVTEAALAGALPGETVAAAAPLPDENKGNQQQVDEDDDDEVVDQ